LSQKIADFTGVSFCYDALGDALFTQGKLSQAEKMYQKNLKLQTKIGDNEGIAHTWGNLGNIAKLRKDYTLARKLYKRQFDQISKIGDVEDMGKSNSIWLWSFLSKTMLFQL
jgi:tetratricopeptide (TPR) repeat protein